MSKNTNLSFLTDYITADITNGRIGINNASPTVAFDVSGATRISGALTLTSTISNGTYTYTLPSATGTLALTSALSSYLPLSGGTLTGALSGTSANFSSSVTAGGNLGSSSDYTALTVRNQANGDYYVGIDFASGTDSGTSSIRSYRTNSAVNYETALTFWTKSTGANPTIPTEKMRITSAGNVGIGTSSPVSLLSLSSSVPIISLIRSDNASTASGGINFYATSTLKWQIGTSLVSGTNGFEFNFAESNVALLNTAGSMGFGTNQLVGNVTAAQVTANMTASRSLIAITTGGNYGNVIGSGAEKYLDLSFYGFNNAELARIRTNDESNVATIGTLTFWTLPAGGSVTERMRITSAGNVGIGTSSPSVNTNQTSLTINGTNNSRLDMQVSGTRNAGFVVASDAAYLETTAAIPLVFYTNSLERMRITSGGNVGIGNTAFSNTRVTITGLGTTSSNYGLVVNNSSNSNLFLVRDDGVVQVSTSNVEIWNANGLKVFTESNGAYWLIRAYNAVSNQLRFNYQGTDLASIATVTGNYTALSDVNKKKDFESSQIGLNEVLGLKPTLYRMKTEDNTQDKHLGFIAQQVKEFIPQAYSETGEGDDKFIGLTEMPIIAALTKAIQELSAEITILKNK